MTADWKIASNLELHAYYEIYSERVARLPPNERLQSYDYKTLQDIDAEIIKRNPGFYDK